MAMSDTITQIRTEKGLTQEQMARRANTTASGAIKRAISRQKMSIWMSSSRQQPKWKLMRWVSHAKKRFLSWPRCSRILIVGRTKPRTETEASVIRRLVGVSDEARLEIDLFPAFKGKPRHTFELIHVVGDQNGAVSKGCCGDQIVITADG